MDVFFQNMLGVDVYVTVESPDDALTVRLYPKRQRAKRGLLLQQMLKNGEGAIVRDQPDDIKIKFDLTALSFRVRIDRRAATDGDVLYEFLLQNGHGHAS